MPHTDNVYSIQNIRMRKHDETCNAVLSSVLAETPTDIQSALEIFWGEMLSVKLSGIPFKPDIVLFMDNRWTNFVQASAGMHPDSLRKLNRTLYKQLWER